MFMAKLGVNIDHIATLRQSRREFDPDPVLAAQVCEQAGADSIVVHLREDRRHIQDRDVVRLREVIKTRLNLEMSLNPGIIKVALSVKPDQVTLVPEKRAELTTEGGLDVVKNFSRVKKAAQAFRRKNIEVSLFVAADKKQILKTKEAGIDVIELHTGHYDHAEKKADIRRELNKLKDAAVYAQSLGIRVNAGHGLKYHNTKAVAQIPGMGELNIGHSIITRAVFVGLKEAVCEMVRIVKG
jgi:pyridoxine 5-phosphate synthase